MQHKTMYKTTEGNKWYLIYNEIVVACIDRAVFDGCNDKFVILHFLAMAEVDCWCINAWDKQLKTRKMEYNFT